VKVGQWVRVNKPNGNIDKAVGKIINIEKEEGVLLYRVHLYQKKLIYWFDDTEITLVKE
jgi:hypothetical protein